MLPLTTQQALDYASALHWHAQAAHAWRHGAIDERAIRELLHRAPGEPAMGIVPVHQIGILRDERLREISDNPQGAKGQWLSEFAQAHRGEPIVVNAGAELTQPLVDRLARDGHRAIAGGAFAPAQTDPQADVFVGHYPDTELRLASRHHAVYFRDPAPFDPDRHLSAHLLSTEIDQPMPGVRKAFWTGGMHRS